ncbi:MAG: hypothetical protein ABSD68_00815 [Candidatus Micrarchaeales archaeon]|jgi:hypothetical protein
MPKKHVENCYYNVHKQLVKRLQFLWYLDSYIKDSKKDSHTECARMWNEIAANERKNIKLLQTAVKRDNR